MIEAHPGGRCCEEAADSASMALASLQRRHMVAADQSQSAVLISEKGRKSLEVGVGKWK